MDNKLEICATKVKEMVITLEYVYKSNFNDTYFLDSKVIDSRAADDGTIIRRRRECIN